LTNYWRLDHDTVMMVLEHYHELSTGGKPENPPGYDNPETKRTGTGCHASYEEMGMLCATVCHRVRRCGTDGMLVEERYGLNLMTAPKNEEQIAQERNIPAEDIYRRINKVTWYCVGRWARKESYEEWKKLKQYRKSEANLSVTDKTLDKTKAKCY